MQLEGKEMYTIIPISRVCIAAEKLIGYLDTPVPKKHAFCFDRELDPVRGFFPSFVAAVGVSQLHNLSQEERRNLKLRLLDDVKTLIAKSSADVNGDKMLQAAPLPSDPQECMHRLNVMLVEGREKIREIQKTISLIGPACDVVSAFVQNKRTIDNFNEDIYTSMPAAVERKKSSAKKAKHG